MTIPKTIHQSWHVHLQPLFDDVKMGMILDEINKKEWYPAKQDVFRVFAMPLDQVKVVILGQDPYPNGQATGLAFAVKETTPIPTSLKIIGAEIYREDAVALHEAFITPLWKSWRRLDHWCLQGIFLLNTALTVEKGIAGSHLGIWKWFTKGVVEIIAMNQPCIWMLWGAKAQSFYVCNSVVVTPDTDLKTVKSKFNVLLKAPHPAAEAYDPTRNPKFTGCNHFNMANAILNQQCKEQILW